MFSENITAVTVKVHRLFSIQMPSLYTSTWHLLHFTALHWNLQVIYDLSTSSTSVINQFAHLFKINETMVYQIYQNSCL